MKKMRVEDAIGMTLAHDLTRIIPGVEKGAFFKRGHLITANDIPLLLDIGKKNVYVTDGSESGVHEDEAGLRIARSTCDESIIITEPAEGKVNLKSPCAGVFRLDESGLMELLEDPEICYSTRTPNLAVKKGDLLASCRIIPLFKPESELKAIEDTFSSRPALLRVDPYLPKKVGLIITGSEISDGRIADAFGPVLVRRNEELGGVVTGTRYPGDEQAAIEQAIRDFIDEGCTMVQLTGGMSVDPDDCTKDAIAAVCDQVVIYGTSVLPGAMFMLAYHQDCPVIGLPGGVVASDFSIFDFVVPRLYTDERLTAFQIRQMAIGGLLGVRK